MLVKIISAAFLLTTWCSIATSAQTNLLLNGSFEDVAGNTCITGSSGCNTSPGDCLFCQTAGNFIPGWRLTSGNLDLYKQAGDPVSDLFAGVPSGSRGVDMNGSNPATIDQTVSNIMPGMPYTIFLRFSNNMKGTSTGCTQDKPLQVNIYNSSNTLIASQTFSTAGLSTLSNTWGAGSFLFTPNTANIRVEIKSLFGDASTVSTCGCCGTLTSFYGPTIDYITLVPGNTSLPVVLKSFSATPAATGSIEANWATATEQAMDRFELQYSTDGIHFNHLETIPANNSSDGSVYTRTIPQPLAASGYYRLKMIDKDQSYSFSATVKVMMKEQYQYHIIREDNKYIVQGLTPGVRLSLTDMQGNRLLEVSNITGNYEIVPDRYPGYFFILSISDGSGAISRMKLTR